MIVGTGVDLAEVPRIRASVERFGRRFVERIFTPGEIAYVERKANKYERYAARFAAKEAAAKVLAPGRDAALPWPEIEVVRTGAAPLLRLHGRAADLAAEAGITALALSFTHEDEYAAAVVLGT